MAKPKVSAEGNHIAEALLEAMKEAAERGDVAQVLIAVRGWVSLDWKIRPNSREHRAIRYSILKATDVVLENDDLACEKIIELAKLLRELNWHITEDPPAKPTVVAGKLSPRTQATEVDPVMGRDLQRLARKRSAEGVAFLPPPPAPPLPSALSRATTIQEFDNVTLDEVFRSLDDSPSLPSFESQSAVDDLRDLIAPSDPTGARKL